MNVKKKFVLLACVCLLLGSSFLSAEIVTRAALDIGSGETKLTIADVDTETNQIVCTLYQVVKSVELRRDLAASADGYLSQKIQKKLIDTLKEMKTETSEFTPEQWFGVGTSVFRKAKNGQDLLDCIKMELDVTILLVPQAEEGEIGFLTAVAASRMNPEDVTAWDSGSGSFQISALIDGHIEVYGAEFSHVPAVEAIFAIFSQNLSPNPVGSEEAIKLAATISEKLPLAPVKWLARKNKQVITIGGLTSIFSLASMAIGQTTYTKNQVWEVILSLCERTDDQLDAFPEPEKTVVGLILLYSVMDHCGIDSLSYFPTNGSCEGILIMPHYWQIASFAIANK